MRLLICFGLAAGLLAGEAPLPGQDPAFLARLLADSEGGRRPWRTFRVPAEAGSAVVEVVGELTPAEKRQVAFQEFLAWFREDLRRFLHLHGGGDLAERPALAALPVERFGGNPVPQPMPLGRIGF